MLIHFSQWKYNCVGSAPSCCTRLFGHFISQHVRQNRVIIFVLFSSKCCNYISIHLLQKKSQKNKKNRQSLLPNCALSHVTILSKTETRAPFPLAVYRKQSQNKIKKIITKTFLFRFVLIERLHYIRPLLQIRYKQCRLIFFTTSLLERCPLFAGQGALHCSL